ncbi:MAG TPA: hypothetical protein PLJ72_06925 [Methanofastidiosum sp.]|nr:hypothetical protein [Methanofastidiosum sp.]
MKKILLAVLIVFGLLLPGVYGEDEYINKLWTHNLGGNVWEILHGDFTGDGKDEIVVASGCCGNPGYVTVFDTEGEIVWQAKLAKEVNSLGIGDINGDGKLEAVTGSKDSHIYFISNSGEVIKNQADSGDILVIKIADLDGDGKNEVVTGSTKIRIFKDMELYKEFGTENRITDIDLYDINGDKKLEIVTGGLGNFVYALDSDLNLLWKDRNNSSVWGTVPFTYNGSTAILVQTRGYYALDKEGKRIPSIEKLNDEYFISGYDAGNMIILSDGKGNTVSYDYALKELWKFKAEKEIKDFYSYTEGNQKIIMMGSMDESFYMVKGDGSFIGSAKAGSYVSAVDSFSYKDKRYVVFGSFDDNVYTYYREIKNVPFYGAGTIIAALIYLLYKKFQ